MRPEQAQLIRLLLMCAAWAIGQSLTRGLGVSFVDTVIPAVLAIGVYAVTDGLGRPSLRRGDAKYWRGRRVDDDERRGGRWN